MPSNEPSVQAKSVPDLPWRGTVSVSCRVSGELRLGEGWVCPCRTSQPAPDGSVAPPTARSGPFPSGSAAPLLSPPACPPPATLLILVLVLVVVLVVVLALVLVLVAGILEFLNIPEFRD